MREIYIKILRNTILFHDYHIFKINSKKNFSSCRDNFFSIVFRDDSSMIIICGKDSHIKNGNYRNYNDFNQGHIRITEASILVTDRLRHATIHCLLIIH